jgi:NTE family protein
MNLMKIGLTLGSGSARGWAHIGVIRCLREAGIQIDMVCGTSIGSLVGGAMAGGFLDDLEKMARNMGWSDIVGFMDLLFPRSGLIGGDKLISHFREFFSDAKIEELALPFGVVATDLTTGREVWLQEGSLMDAVRASISMPGVFTPCKYGDKWLVGGGLVNPVPVSLCRAMGADIVIAVNLNSDIIGLPKYLNRAKQEKQEDDSGKKYKSKFARFLSNHLMPAYKQMEEKILADEHSIYDVVAASINIMQDRITRQRLGGDPPDLMVAPRLSHIGLLEYNRAAEAIEEGHRSMSFMVPMLKVITKD